MSKVEEITARVTEAHQVFQKTCREAVKEIFDDLFVNHPEIKTVYWSQYTPYFNDGDECIFNVHDINVSPDYFEEIDSPYHDDENEQNFNIPPNLAKAIKEINKFASDNLQAMKDMFGDHAFVRAHTGGFEVREYEHD